MKKFSLLLSFMVFGILYSQTVTTEPAILTDDYTGIIKVIYNPGSSPMSTAAQCYAHIGVKTGGVRWQCAPIWRSGLEKHKLVKNGTNWELIIDNMYTYFSGCAGPFQELDMVFNDGPGGTKEGKTSTGGDFFINISPANLLIIQFSSTSSSGIISLGSSVNITANSTSTASIVLKKNGTTVSTASGTSITFSETLSSPGDYIYTVEATANGNTASDTRNIAIVSAPSDQPRPNGLKEGVTYHADPTKLHCCLYVKDKNNVLPDNVLVIGDFNDWTISNSYQLKKDGTTGYWWIELTGLEPGIEYAYQYIVKKGNTTVNISDPYATKVLHPDDIWEPSQYYQNLKPYPANADGSYVAVFQTNKTNYNWSAQTLGFIKPNKNNLVIYEIWVHDFAPNKNLKSITDRLDYIKNLGVNAIELMPVAEFEGNVSWGYNPTHYFALDKAYGSENDLKKLVDEAHKRGIAVILDMVFNHVTGLAPQAKLYWETSNTSANNPWFNQLAPHGTSVFQDWNHNFGPTRDLFKRVLNYWIEEYKIDGYRMDISHGFCGENCSNRSEIVFDYYNNGVKSANVDAYFILEHWEEAPGEKQNYINWGMLCWLNNTHSYEQTAMGWLHDGDGLDASNQDGWVTYCESHDEERNMYKAKTYGNGPTLRSTPGYTYRTPLNTAFNVMLNGPHMLWMFQELAYDYSIFSNASGASGNRTDPKPVPETLGWYSNSLRMISHKKIAQTIQLRTQILTEVFEGNPTNTDLGSGKAARSIIWGTGDKRVFIVGNFNAPSDGTTYTGSVNITLPIGNNWFDYYENSNNALNAGTSIPLQPGEIKIYTAKKLPLPVVPVNYDFLSTADFSEATIDVKVYPTCVTDELTIDTKETIRYIQLINMNGQTSTPGIINNKLQLSSMPSGMYILHIMFNNGNTKAFKIYKN